MSHLWFTCSPRRDLAGGGRGRGRGPSMAWIRRLTQSRLMCMCVCAGRVQTVTYTAPFTFPWLETSPGSDPGGVTFTAGRPGKPPVSSKAACGLWLVAWPSVVMHPVGWKDGYPLGNFHTLFSSYYWGRSKTLHIACACNPCGTDLAQQLGSAAWSAAADHAW